MTRRKAKKQKLEAARLRRVKQRGPINPCDPNVIPPTEAIMANPQALSHNNTYGPMPRFYVDQLMQCRQCGKEEVWRAEAQQWWYEVAKGNINTKAVLCRACRSVEKQRKEEARKQHQEGLALKKERG